MDRKLMVSKARWLESAIVSKVTPKALRPIFLESMCPVQFKTGFAEIVEFRPTFLGVVYLIKFCFKQ